MNILFPAQDYHRGSSFYRTYQPLIALGKLDPRAQVKCIKSNRGEGMTDEQFNQIMGGADIFMTSLPGDIGEPLQNLQGLAEYNRERAKVGRAPLRYVVDVDDWFPACPVHNIAYAAYGREEKVCHIDNDNEVYEFKFFNGDKIEYLGNTITFDTERNKRFVETKLAHIRAAHAVTTTTEKLAARLREYNTNVYVLPNGLDIGAYEPKEKSGREVRIGYTYSGSHVADWIDIAPHLRNWLNRTPFVKLVLMGTKQFSLRGFELDKVERHEFKKFDEGYHEAFNRLNIDIGIAPLLEDGAEGFNEYKSNLKWLEYSAVKACTVAPFKLYGATVRDGETGLLYKTPEEFIEKLNKAVKEKQLREKIADNAHKEVLAKYDIRELVPAYYNTFEKILSQKEIVNYEKNPVPAV